MESFLHKARFDDRRAASHTEDINAPGKMTRKVIQFDAEDPLPEFRPAGLEIPGFFCCAALFH
jgi:hypothetical protein